MHTADARAGRDLAVVADLWRLAWPMVAVGWLRTGMLLADAWWVGRLGARELEALAGASFAAWILDHVGELGAAGVHARVAHADGAGERARFGEIAASGALVGAVAWALLAVTSGALVPAYVAALGVPGALAAPTASFLHASVAAAPGLFLLALVGGVLRGVGRTQAALVVTGAGLAGNVALDPVLIFGWGGAPALGLAGAAWATGIAAGLAGLAGLGWLVADGTLRPAWPRRSVAIVVARVGAPLAVAGVGFALVYVVLGRLIAGFGAEHLAAIGIGHRLEGVPYLAAAGLAVAVATRVGQHLGAQDPERARAVVRAAVRLSDGLMVVSAAVALWAAEPIYALFTDDPAIVAAGAVYLRWQAMVWVAMGRELLFEGAFTGASHTLPALAWGGGLTLARIPLAGALAWGAGLGVQGVWVAVAASTAGKGIALGLAWSRASGPRSTPG